MSDGALPEGVQAPPVEVVSDANDVLCVAIICIDDNSLVPIFGLVRVDARSAEPVPEQAGHCERLVTETLSGQPKARASGEEAIVGVPRDHFGRRGGILTEG